MSIIVTLDVMLVQRGVSSGELAKHIGITEQRLSVFKRGNAKAMRLTTLEVICNYLNCQPGDILNYQQSHKAKDHTFNHKFKLKE